MIKFIKSFFKKNIVINGTEYSDTELRDMEERFTDRLYLIGMQDLIAQAENSGVYTVEELEHLATEKDRAMNGMEFGLGEGIDAVLDTVIDDIISDFRSEKEAEVEQAEIDVEDDRENKQLLRLEYEDNLL